MKALSKFDLNQVVRKLADLRQHEHHHQNIKVVLDLTELPKITADHERIECVLHALFVRSRKCIVAANKPHGTITLRTVVNAGKIQFSITDDGIGFFSGPEPSLDLTTCAGIVQDQEGELYAWRPRHPAVTTIMMDLPI
jgi:nitrogen fixation/metabolism regulation signal transduction histidine kinase